MCVLCKIIKGCFITKISNIFIENTKFFCVPNLYFDIFNACHEYV